MDFKYFISLFKQSSKVFYKNPFFIILGLALIALNFILSKLSTYFTYLSSNSLFSFLFFLLTIFLSTPIFLSLVSFSKDSLNGKGKIKFNLKLWIPLFGILLISLFAYYLAYLIPSVLTLYIGKLFSLSVTYAQLIFFVIYLIGLLLALFLLYSGFILVAKNQSFLTSIKSGAKLTKKEYLLTLSVVLVFYVLNQIISYLSFIHSLIPTFIYNLILFPFLILVLTKIVLDKS